MTPTKKKQLFKLIKTNYALYKHFKACTDFLEPYVNEHVFMNLESLSMYLRFGKIVHVSRISTTRTKWDIGCSSHQGQDYHVDLNSINMM